MQHAKGTISNAKRNKCRSARVAATGSWDLGTSAQSVRPRAFQGPRAMTTSIRTETAACSCCAACQGKHRAN
eukprot:15479080-Alexandrium_andersonii.AAC.1